MQAMQPRTPGWERACSFQIRPAASRRLSSHAAVLSTAHAILHNILTPAVWCSCSEKWRREGALEFSGTGAR